MLTRKVKFSSDFIKFITVASIFIISEHSWLRTFSKASVFYPVFFIITVISYIVVKSKEELLLVERNSLEVLIVMIFLRCLHIMSQGFTITYDVAFLIMIITVFLVDNMMDLDEFFSYIRKILIVICIVSSLGYVLQYSLNVFAIFPSVELHAGRFVCIGLANVNMNSAYMRNFGIFYEPGIFQLYINLFLFIELFYRRTPNLKVVIIYCFTVITTMSTSGYISMALIMLLFLFNKYYKKDDDKLYNKMLVMFIFGVFIVGILYSTGFINWRVFDKFNASDGNSSASERFRAVRIAWQLFMSNPIIGTNSDSYVKSIYGNEYVIMTATPLNWFAKGGILNGLFYNIGYLGILNRCKFNSVTKVLGALVLITLVASQASEECFIILVICMCVWKQILSRGVIRNRFLVGE